MSLSQKHSGKVFVPWVNTQEWKQVYYMLCVESKRNYPFALSIIQLWKIRTPLLSAGIEGTLILLEAILMDKTTLSDFQLTQIYAVSLMRFINVCATNSDKQGTFYKTAVKNELPKWLISIRHDISHDNKLPSKSMLELGLNQCLEWIKLKYWEENYDSICDFNTEDSEDFSIIDILTSYCKIKLMWFNKEDVNDSNNDTVKGIHELISKISKKYKTTTDADGVISVLEEITKLCCPKLEDKSKNICENISKVLVNDQIILFTTIEVNSEGKKTIPRDFRNIWKTLLSVLYEKGLIFCLLNELLNATQNVVNDDHKREVASAWISEIFLGLQKVKDINEELENIEMSHQKLDSRTSKIVLKSILNKKNPEYKDCLEFDPPNCLCNDEAQAFLGKVLHDPNKYTNNFLERVLKFNKFSDSYISDIFNLVEKLISSNTTVLDEQTYNIDNLKEILYKIDLTMDWEGHNRIEGDKTNINDLSDVNDVPNINKNFTKRWRRIKDTTIYQGCPLGVLPHQNRSQNAFLFVKNV